MASGSYGVTWHERGSGLVEGRLRFAPAAVVFDGRDERDHGVHREIDYRDITGLQVVDDDDQRPGDHTLLLHCRAGEVAIRGTATRRAVLQEIASALAALSLGRLRRVVIVLPLRDGSTARAQELVGAGPPFDPADVPLLRHEVFLTSAEAVFVFEAPSADALESVLSHLDVWAAAAAWRDVVAGEPRIAEVAYSWHQPEPPVSGLGF